MVPTSGCNKACSSLRIIVFVYFLQMRLEVEQALCAGHINKEHYEINARPLWIFRQWQHRGHATNRMIRKGVKNNGERANTFWGWPVCASQLPAGLWLMFFCPPSDRPQTAVSTQNPTECYLHVSRTDLWGGGWPSSTCCWDFAGVK